MKIVKGRNVAPIGEDLIPKDLLQKIKAENEEFTVEKEKIKIERSKIRVQISYKGQTINVETDKSKTLRHLLIQAYNYFFCNLLLLLPLFLAFPLFICPAHLPLFLSFLFLPFYSLLLLPLPFILLPCFSTFFQLFPFCPSLPLPSSLLPLLSSSSAPPSFSLSSSFYSCLMDRLRNIPLKFPYDCLRSISK